MLRESGGLYISLMERGPGFRPVDLEALEGIGIHGESENKMCGSGARGDPREGEYTGM